MASHGLAECRLTVAGDGGVGKSCLVIQMVQSHFVDEYDPTIEDSYRKQRIIDGLPILVEILDTAGQEEYTAMREQWIRESQAIVLVYSVTSRHSFEGAWEDGRLVGGIRQLHQQILRVKDFDPTLPHSQVGPSTTARMIAKTIPIMLAGNKCDLDYERKVSMDEGRSLAAELGCMFVEVSAKSRINVDKAFDDPVREHFRLQNNRVMPEPLVDTKSHSSHRRVFSSPASLPKLSLGSSFQRFLKAVKVDIKKERKNDRAHQQALNTVLVQTCRRNDLRGAQKCLANGADPNVSAGTDGNALHTACALGHAKIVTFLLQNGAKPEVKGSREMSALQLASSEGNLKVVKILLKANACIDTANPAHGTALVAATARRRIDVVDLLIKYGANVNIGGGQYGGALHTAAVLGDVDLARLLLHNGASVFQRGKQNSTALQLTCRAGYPKLVQLLLDHGSDPNAVGGELGCAHEAAIRASRSDVFDLLAEKADPARCASNCRSKISPAQTTAGTAPTTTPATATPTATPGDGARTEADLAVVNSTLQSTSASNRSMCPEPTPSEKGSVVPSPKDYSVGIVCPMAIELISVEGMLDKFHPALSFPNSQNIYVLGVIGEHNVVVTVMPEIGNNHAAIVATQLRNDFPTLRCVLLVGVGGGLPNDQTDIRLGDVVISNPTAAGGGVIQYDLGKHVGDGRFVRTGQLPKPPAFLNAAVHRLEARHALEGSQIQTHLTEMLAKYPRTTDKYKRPAAEYDLLFASDCPHQPYESSSDPICAHCDRTQLLHRPTRTNDDPVVHFGTIGSANALIKDSFVRDRLKRDSRDMICVVEMEAAGLMESYPCLVIRGICDYSDSHKSKLWQPYAAAVAAGYMKELVLTLPLARS